MLVTSEVIFVVKPTSVHW